jgi:hypothetical protein
MSIPNDTRLNYDNSSYQEKIERSLRPGLYQLTQPYNDCTDCATTIPNDPYLRYQTYGPNTCTMKTAINDLNELNGLNYRNSKCNKDAYQPDTYTSTGCKTKTNLEIRKCAKPTESSRISNPPCTLKETGINRYDPLLWNPQEKALEVFDRIPVNYRMVAKDNHVPLLEVPQDPNLFKPICLNNNNNTNTSLKQWQEMNKNNLKYSPGYPYGQPNYQLSCKQQINSY